MNEWANFLIPVYESKKIKRFSENLLETAFVNLHYMRKFGTKFDGIAKSLEAS